MASTGSSPPCLWSRWWRCPDFPEIAYGGQGQDRDNRTSDLATVCRIEGLARKTVALHPHRHVRDMAVPADLSGRREPLRDSRMRPGRIHFSETLRAPFGRQTTGVSPSFFFRLFFIPVPLEREKYLGGSIFHGYFSGAVSPIVLSCLGLRPPGPCSRTRTGGGQRGGRTPPFRGLVRPWTPLRFFIAGVVGPPSPGGVAPS